MPSPYKNAMNWHCWRCAEQWYTAALAEWSAPIQARRHSTRVHNPAVESVWRRSRPGQPACECL
ncbi:hypothetical protein ACLK1S_23815 [Escherichia coli]